MILRQYLDEPGDRRVIAIPLAAGVLASEGIVLSPAVGAVLMSLSTVVRGDQRPAASACKAMNIGQHQMRCASSTSCRSLFTLAPGLLQFDRRKPGIEAESRP
jgi:hypothetical protein